jgi:hypothetical protein
MLRNKTVIELGKITILLLVALILFGVNPLSVTADPPMLPSSFYGTVKIDGADVAAGTVITAEVSGQSYTATVIISDDQSVYTMDIPGDSNSVGETVTFKIGDLLVPLTNITWQSGTNLNVNLSNTDEPDLFFIYLPLIMR